MKKRSDVIREDIGHLMYEMQVFQNAGNDEAVQRCENAINKLRSKILLVEDDERKCQSGVIED